MTYAAALREVRAHLTAKAAAATACYAVCEGNIVRAVAQDARDANVRLCAMLDTYFSDNPAAMQHSFDIKPLRVVPTVGAPFDPATVVFYP